MVIDTDKIGTSGTYKITASDYVSKYDPSYVGRNEAGVWYEHPVFGDESPLLVATEDNKIHQRIWWEVPDINDEGELY